jgi:WD40 repeat protein
MPAWCFRRVAPLALCLLAFAPAAPAADEKVPAGPPFLTIDAGGHRAQITQALFTPDSQRLITVSRDKTIRVWDVANREPVRVLRPPIGPGRQGELLAAALSPDGKTLAVGGFGYFRGGKRTCPIFLVSLEKGEIIRSLRGHGAAVRALAFAPVGNVLASGGAGGGIFLWDVDTGKVLHKLPGHKGGTTDLAFAPRGKRLASVGNDGVGRIWSVESGAAVAELKSPGDSVRYTVDWGPNGKHIVTGLSRHTDPHHTHFALWGPGGKLQKKALHFKGRLMVTRSLRFTPDSKQVVQTCSDKYYAQNVVFDVATGAVARVLTYENHLFHEVAEGPCAVAPNGKLLAVADDRNHLTYLYHLPGGKLARKLGGKGRQVTEVGWAAGKDGGPAVVWRNTLTGQYFKPWEPIPPKFFERCFRLDELTLAPVPKGPFRWRRYEMKGARLVFDRENIGVYRGKEKSAVLRTPGVDGEWALETGFTMVTPERAVVSRSTGFFCLDTRTGKLLHALRGPNGVIRAAAPSPGQPRLLLAGGDDQVLRFWSAESPEPILSLFVAGPDWVAWTSHGYYAASPGGERLMGWHVNNGPDRMATFYPAERFRKRLFNPELLREVLRTGKPQEVVQNLPPKERARSVEDMLPPRVNIRVEQDAANKARVTVHVTAESVVKGQPVESLRLLVNGRALPDDQGVFEPKAPRAKLKHTWTIAQMPPGVLKLKVLAQCPDVSGLSPARAVRVPTTPKDRPALHVLSVGLNYTGKAGLALDCPVNDAEAIAKAFGAACAGGDNLFRMDSPPRKLLEEKATAKAVLQELAGLRKKVKPQDLLVFFFAGHGVRKGGEFYLLTSGADVKDLAKTALSGSQLRDRLRGYPCQVLLLDACHSGAANRALVGLTPATDAASRRLADAECGVTLMAAAMGYQRALEGGGKNGYFTQGVLKGLRKARGLPYNYRDGRQYVHHLFSFVFDEVKELSGDRQHPFLSLPWTTESFAVRQVTAPEAE